MSELPKRRRNRKHGYDYTQPGRYFITVVVERRLHLFGEVVAGCMNPNPAGQMVEEWWRKLEEKFERVELHDHVVMPNHFHGIIGLLPSDAESTASLSDVMGWFQTMTTNAYIRGVKQHDWRRFEGKLWKRSFYDHVIRRPDSFERTAWYIKQNPARWHLDRENEDRVGEDEFDRWLEQDAASDSGENDLDSDAED